MAMYFKFLFNKCLVQDGGQKKCIDDSISRFFKLLVALVDIFSCTIGIVCGLERHY